MDPVSCRHEVLHGSPAAHSPTLANSDVIVPKTISPLTLSVFPRCMAAVARFYASCQQAVAAHVLPSQAHLQPGLQHTTEHTHRSDQTNGNYAIELNVPACNRKDLALQMVCIPGAKGLAAVF
jgi:hypothetical protein